MLPHPCDFKNEIVSFLEGRLDPRRRGAFQSHLGDCESCRQDLETWSWLERNCIGHRAVPAESDGTLESRRAAWSRKRSCRAGHMPGSRLWSPCCLQLLSGLVFAVVAVVGLRHFWPLPDFPSEVAQDYRKIRTGKLDLERYTQDPKELDRFFAGRGVPFSTRVANLRDLHYYLVGGRVHQLINRRSALYLYRGRSGEILLCEMYVGDIAELPSGGLLRENQERRFLVYRAQALNLVFWQDGSMTCVLAADLEPEQLLQAAQAEARRS